MHNRGQIFGTDTIVAVIIFVITLTIFVLYSNQLSIRIDSLKVRADNFELAQQSLLRITQSPGIPSNWELLNFDQIESIGIMESPGVIDQNKLLKLISMDSNDYLLKNEFGLGQFNFRLSVNDLNGVELYEFGDDANSDIDVSKSMVVMNLTGSKVFVQLEVFD